MDLESILELFTTFILGLFLFKTGFDMFRINQMIENTPRSKIKSLAMGLVEVAGVTVPIQDNNLKDPINDKSTLFISYSLHKYNRIGKRKWTIVTSSLNAYKFYVNDGTGYVLVDPLGAKVTVENSIEYNSDTNSTEIENRILNFLRIQGIDARDYIGNGRKFKFIQNVIYPNQYIHVLGTADRFTDLNYTKNSDTIVIKKGNHKILKISDQAEKILLDRQNRIAFLLIGSGILFMSLVLIFIK